MASLRGRAGPHCHQALALTGQDIARISQVLEVAPTTFVAAMLAPHDSGAVVLLPAPRGGPPIASELVLARHAEAHAENPSGSACVFLLTLGSGRRACGLDALAPTACGLASATEPDARAALTARSSAEAAAWRARLAAWSELMAARRTPLPLEVFLDHVLAVSALEPACADEAPR